MADSIKDKVANAGQAVADAAKQAKDWVADKTGLACSKDGADAKIKERMDVIASCGTKVGVVDHVDDGAIQLTKNDSPDGQHHFIPTQWVDRVDQHVHLRKNSMETKQGWKTDAASCGACGM